MMIEDGVIETDSAAGKLFGFTAERFEGWLWKQGNRIMVSMIVSLRPGHGHLSQLFTAIERAGFSVAVPTPFATMRAILQKKGFVPHEENDPDTGPCQVWERVRCGP